jgi:hypothetical protein
MLRAALDRARSSLVTTMGRQLLGMGCEGAVAVSCRRCAALLTPSAACPCHTEDLTLEHLGDYSKTEKSDQATPYESTMLYV